MQYLWLSSWSTLCSVWGYVQWQDLMSVLTPSCLFRWDHPVALQSFIFGVACTHLKASLMHVWPRTHYVFLTFYVVVLTRVHIINNVKVFCFDIRISLRLLFCDADELNSLLFWRWSFVLRVTASPDASSLCVSSVKCAPLWEESLLRSTSRWRTSHHMQPHSQKHLYRVLLKIFLCPS